MAALKPHNDEPTLEDRLGYADQVQRVGKEIAGCDPPAVFGIHGDWGAGKTSFLHQLHFYLTGTCPPLGVDEKSLARTPELAPKRVWGKDWRLQKRVTVIWFEAWHYQHEKAPIVALLQEIRTQLPWYSKFLNETGKLTEVAIRAFLLSLEDLTKKIGIQASKIEKAGKEWEEAHFSTTLPSHVIREQLNSALNGLLGQK